MRRTGFGAATVLALALIGSGCQTFRAEVGLGLGIGTSFSIPAVLHTGVAFGNFKHMGWGYHEGFHFGHEDGEWWDMDIRFLFIHIAEMRDRFAAAEPGGDYVYFEYRTWAYHVCAGVAPVVFQPYQAISYGLELEAQLLFFDIRLGWNPWYLTHDLPYDEDALNRGEFGGSRY